MKGSRPSVLPEMRRDIFGVSANVWMLWRRVPVTDRIIANRYRLIVPLGQGGMGTVWKAMDQLLDTHVAVKLLDPGIAEHEKALTRFFREAKMIAKLRSRHVVRVLECGLDHNQPFIAMELLEGQTLRAKLNESQPLTAQETALILGDVARAMHVAHERGITHRDLKPDNIFIAWEDDEAVVKVFDFGIAKGALTSDSATGPLTTMGTLFGTPNYMSPEQVDARAVVDHRTDIWAYGVIAFECLTGRVPFNGDTLHEQLLAVCMRPIPKPSSLGAVPPGFDEWFAKASHRDLAQRFATALEARAALLAVCGVQSIPTVRSDASTSSVPKADEVGGTQVISSDAAALGSSVVRKAVVTNSIRVETSPPVTTTNPGAKHITDEARAESRTRQFKLAVPVLATVGLLVFAGLCVVLGRGISGKLGPSSSANSVQVPASANVLATPTNAVPTVPSVAQPEHLQPPQVTPERQQDIAIPEASSGTPIELVATSAAPSAAPPPTRSQKNTLRKTESSTQPVTRRPRIDLGLP